MGKYKDVNCPICGKPLENGEDVVICPDCGAPYHRDCVNKNGKCIYENLHEQHKSWEMPKVEIPKFAGDEPKRCSRCGTINPINGLFCEVCGNALTPPTTPETTDDFTQKGEHTHPNMNDCNTGGQGQIGTVGQSPMGHIPHQMAYDPFTTPFGGVNPDEDIDAIPVKDWAIYVGQNTQYFIPKFKAFSEKLRGGSFNFAAAFFRGFYFLYRKMYAWGVLLLIVQLLLTIPSMLLQVDIILKNLDPSTAARFTSDAMLSLANVCMILNWGTIFAAGMLTNKLYKYHCREKITKIKSEVKEHSEYVAKLTRTGSVSRKLMLILVGIYFLGSVGLSMLLLSNVIKL